MRTLLVVGAGPKAVALAAKAAVLRESGVDCPRVVAVEAQAIGANWLPGGGWTDGNQQLGTSPEKDVGFPYRSDLVPRLNRSIDARMTAFSWTSFLIQEGGYAEWVDRGRPSPRHRVWARYLQWAAEAAGLVTVIGTATGVRSDGAGWQVSVRTRDGVTELVSDGLVFTGPGSSRDVLLPHPRMLSVAEFWDRAGRRDLPTAARTAVIGGGETAGSVLDQLARHDTAAIAVVSPMATLYSRGESYFENALFSDPSRWSGLSEAERRDVIRRTDRGVFSVRVQQALLADHRVRHLQGRVIGARDRGEEIALKLRNENRPEQTHNFDLVVDATGGRPLWFLDLFDPSAADLLELAVGWPVTQERIEAAIGPDLAVRGMAPKLFLPNLAGPAQGPGFPNLSCLGALSDRVLRGSLVTGRTERTRSSAGAPARA